MRRLHRSRSRQFDVTPKHRRELRRRMLSTSLAVLIFVTSFPQNALLAGGCSGGPTGNPSPPGGPPPCGSNQCCPRQSGPGIPGYPGGGGGGGGGGAGGPGPVIRGAAGYGPTSTMDPIYLKYGTVAEAATDLSLPGPAFGWSMERTYNSGGTGVSSLGNLWLSGDADQYLVQSGANIAMIVSANSQRLFTGSGTPPTYTAPADSNLKLTHDSGNDEYILTDAIDNIRYTFHDFTVTTVVERGKLKGRSSLQWNSQGNFGLEYYYNSTGKISQITTSDGQDYTIAFTYSGSAITKVEIKDGTTVLERVEYTYYQNVTTPSTDIGTTGDLVQVKVSRDATNDTPGTLSIVRYTQYRYSAGSKLKTIFDHDAIQRVIDSDSGISTPADVLTKSDTYGTPDIVTFASRSFTYYSANTATTSVATPFNGLGENLNTLYGGAEVAELGFAKTEAIGAGCSSCGGSTAGLTKTYFYLTIDQGATILSNEVTQLVIEDTQDSAGTAVYRTIWGLNKDGRQLRKVFIDDPTGTPRYWCESWTLATSGKEGRVAEYRMPSAHNVTTASALRNFLDPYDSEGASWSNDTNTLHSSDGLLNVYTYNSGGSQTDHKVKKGRTGTEYYVGAWDFGDGDGDSTGSDHTDGTLLVAEYAYPTQTTTRADGKKTQYSYTFWDSSDREIKTRTTTLPVIPTTQNGSGVATTSAEYYDNLGRLRWTQDGEGYINYYSYNPVTGGEAYAAIDVNPASPGSDITSGSSGNWDAVSVGSASSNQPTRSSSLPTPLALATKVYFDDQGWQSKTVEPGGAEHYTIYSNTQTIHFPYWNSGTGQCLLPIQLTQLNSGGQVTDEIAVRASYSAISTSGGTPTGFSTAPSQSDYVRGTHTTYDSVGRLSFIDRYATIPSSGSGTLGSDFYRSVTQYDLQGREQYDIQVVRGSASNNRVEQVTQYVYDVRDRVIEQKQGVSGDTAANSHDMTDNYNSYPTLVTLSKTEYDNGGVGDGYVTKSKRYFGTGTNDYTGIIYKQTYRGHVRGVEPFYMNGSTETAVGPYSVTDVNWSGQTTATAQFRANPTWATVLTGDGYTTYASSTASNRGMLSEITYDDTDRAYRTNTFAIDASTGAKGSSHQSDVYYDRLGRVVASQPAYQAGSEIAYDGTGRSYHSRTVLDLETTKYVSGAYNYRDPQPQPMMSSMTGGDDNVLTLSHNMYDASGNVTGQHSFSMNHDDTGATLGIDLSNNDDYVRSSIYTWYDDADRVTMTGNYGSGDTTAGAGKWKYAAVPARPATAPTASGETVLVTKYTHDSDTGEQTTVTDPMGYKSKSFFDDLGRQIWLAENYDNFDPATLSTISDGTDDSKDRVTKTEYDGLDNTTKLIAYNGSSSVAEATHYLYEDSINASRVTNTIYPDSSDTTSSGSDQVKVTYNADGTVSQRTDQRGTVIAYAFDSLRRSQSQKVTTLGGSTDGDVRSITRGYDTLGRVAKITSHGNQTDDPNNAADIRNQIVYTYNDLGQITISEQSHSGAVGGSTPSVQYAYDSSSVSSVFDDGARMESITYPNGRVLFSDYGTSDALEDRAGIVRRLRETNGTGTILAEYSHTGSGSTVLTDFQQPDLKLDLFGGTSGTYAGMDRFGRTIDHRWYDYTSGTVDRARYSYGYDHNGSRTWKEDSVAAANSVNQDEFYTSDGLKRLKAADRGDLNGMKTAVSTLTFGQDWNLDQLGNWPNFTEDTDGNGTDELDQDRSHNHVNEIIDIDASSTYVAHDAAGNMTKVPKPASWSTHYDLTWDAWNRLVKVVDVANTVAEYQYDGENRRIVKKLYVGGSLDETRHIYLSQGNQVLEERVDASTNPDRQFTWGTRYIDDLVLRTRDTDADGSLDDMLYGLQDANWHVTALADTSGSIVERFVYDPYGKSTVLDANFTADSDGVSDYDWESRFTSREYDSETGMHYFRARYYHDTIGRFIGRDLLGFVDGTNLYAAYFLPSGVDPTGEFLIHVACAAACVGCAGVKLIGDYYCGGFNDPEDQAYCMQTYWDSLPSWHRALHGGACVGCIACLVRYAKPVIKKVWPVAIPIVRKGGRQVWNGCKWVWKQGRCGFLKLSKIAACDITKGLTCTSGRRKCIRGLTRSDFTTRAGLFSACAAARGALQASCYKPGDPLYNGHMQQIKNNSQAAANCAACAVAAPVF
ncbi:MAG: RHS repeat-associated core domain-containing protein [Planctomycetaceae bacterium]